MIKCGNWPVGVCSWSLQQDISQVAQSLIKLDIEHIHLALAPALGKKGEDYLAAVCRQNWTISSTMMAFAQEDYSSLESIKLTGGVRPDEYWPENKRLTVEAIKLTARLGVKFLSMHAGFIDHSDTEYSKKFNHRIKTLADAAGENQIMLLLETGQETAAELREFLEESSHPALGVNFDPANMILYDKGDPLEAVRILAPWVKHIHIKDALRTKTPGTWGREVPWGDGEVGAQIFLPTLRKIGYEGVLAIEREAGYDRLGDITLAVQRLKKY